VKVHPIEQFRLDIDIEASLEGVIGIWAQSTQGPRLHAHSQLVTWHFEQIPPPLGLDQSG
jgi:hypothetical protein